MPGIARRAEAAWLSHGENAEFGRAGAANQHEARIAQAAHHIGVTLSAIVAVEVRTHRQRLARDWLQLLDREWYAREGTRVARLNGVGGGQRSLGVHQRKGVERPHRGETFERRLDQFAG